jgi:membrane-bound lytic murein transglycosylase D
MLQIGTKMRKILIATLFCLFLPFIGAKELAANQVDEAVEAVKEEINEEDPFFRPIRQVRAAHPYAAKPHSEAPVLLTLKGINEPLTQKYIEQYTSVNGKRWLTTIIKRSEPYLAFIRAEIERRKMPYEFIYLPVIESAYSPSAVSRAGAAGLWQFMTNSIGPYDMKVTEWMDERRDFWKSTLGALNKLGNEYKRVGSWELALAAYNAGLGTVLNGKKKFPDADYWELCQEKVFKKETINYVPRLIAVAHILSNPRQYGLEPLWPEDPQWTRIPVGRPVDLALVAQYAGLPGADLKKANVELIYGITPPDPNYHIKAPAAHAPLIASVLEDKELTLIKYYFHIIRSGDTLSGIAQRYGVTENQIRSNNPGLKEKYLKIGQKLVIPAYREIKQNAPRKETASNTGSGIHLVKKGESLWSIALAYNTSPETLAQLNGMGLNDVLRAGANIKISGGQ